MCVCIYIHIYTHIYNMYVYVYIYSLWVFLIMNFQPSVKCSQMVKDCRQGTPLPAGRELPYSAFNLSLQEK